MEVVFFCHLSRAARCKSGGSASSLQDPPQAAFLSAPLQFSSAMFPCTVNLTTCPVNPWQSWALTPHQHTCEEMQGVSRASLPITSGCQKDCWFTC